MRGFVVPVPLGSLRVLPYYWFAAGRRVGGTPGVRDLQHIEARLVRVLPRTPIAPPGHDTPHERPVRSLAAFVFIEVRRTPLGRSSQNAPSTTFANKGKREGRGC